MLDGVRAAPVEAPLRSTVKEIDVWRWPHGLCAPLLLLHMLLLTLCQCQCCVMRTCVMRRGARTGGRRRSDVGQPPQQLISRCPVWAFLEVRKKFFFRVFGIGLHLALGLTEKCMNTPSNSKMSYLVAGNFISRFSRGRGRGT